MLVKKEGCKVELDALHSKEGMFSAVEFFFPRNILNGDAYLIFMLNISLSLRRRLQRIVYLFHPQPIAIQ